MIVKNAYQPTHRIARMVDMEQSRKAMVVVRVVRVILKPISFMVFVTRSSILDLSLVRKKAPVMIKVSLKDPWESRHEKTKSVR